MILKSPLKYFDTRELLNLYNNLMIRKNYSLADELRKQESKRQKKAQDKQKYNLRHDKLKDVKPRDLYRKIQRVRAIEAKTPNDHKHLKSLEEDWNFMKKHNMHKDELERMEAEAEKEKKQQEIVLKKLWGLKSVYFNPELNPLGKVPNASKLPFKLRGPLANETIPLKPSQKQHIEPDPLIKQYNITPPEGEPPRFYKKVFNTGREHITTISNEINDL